MPKADELAVLGWTCLVSAAGRTPGPRELPKSSIGPGARVHLTLLSLSLGPTFTPKRPVTITIHLGKMLLPPIPTHSGVSLWQGKDE